jgi:phage gpG-like protein
MSLRNNRTGKEFGQEMNEQRDKFEKFVANELPDKIVVIAQKNVDDSFQKEQFQDGKSEKWDDRKNDDESGLPRDKRRALLVKEGDLIRDVNAERSGSDIVVGTDVPYAQRHNEGLEDMPQRQFMTIPGESNPVIDKQVEELLDNAMDKFFS